MTYFNQNQFDSPCVQKILTNGRLKEKSMLQYWIPMQPEGNHHSLIYFVSNKKEEGTNLFQVLCHDVEIEKGETKGRARALQVSSKITSSLGEKVIQLWQIRKDVFLVFPLHEIDLRSFLLIDMNSKTRRNLQLPLENPSTPLKITFLQDFIVIR